MIRAAVGLFVLSALFLGPAFALAAALGEPGVILPAAALAFLSDGWGLGGRVGPWAFGWERSRTI